MRDDFTNATIERLAKRAGNVCSNPGCRRPTAGAAKGHDGFMNVGVASHITAAAPGGPRYDSSLSKEERRSQTNGIWMCQVHGKAVDDDDSHFKVETLREWKRLAEERSFNAIMSRDGVDALSLDPTPHHAQPPPVAFADFLTAAKADLEAFKRMHVWPARMVPIGIRVVHGTSSQHFDAVALAGTLDTFNEIAIIAAPGTGKTTTLLQIADAVLSRATSVALFFPLSEWSSQPGALLTSVLQREAFNGRSEEELKRLARSGHLVLLLDGWNELDSESRRRARGDIQRLQRDFPALGVVISSRRQAMDVPIAGPIAELEPLTDHQQLEIASSLRGPQGKAILDHARRTPGIRSLVSIPLYLAALLSHVEGEKLPTSKEEVLRLFVFEHEKLRDNAEVLHRELLGLHSQLLTALALEATRLESTALSDDEARATLKREEVRLIAECQVTGLPQPTSVLDLLVSHHLLNRPDGRSGGVSFQHQQFQEWYASFHVEDLMKMAGSGDSASNRLLREGPLNIRSWEESVLFACERASRQGEAEVQAVAAAVMEALGIDPMLASEMIHRSAPAVWEAVRDRVVGFAQRWHTSGTVDRAVRFMINTGRADFAPLLWPLISNEDDQVHLAAFRAAYRFRPSVLGDDFEERICKLGENARSTLTSQIAYEGDFAGIEAAARFATRDQSSVVKLAVIHALDFRRADGLVAEVLNSSADDVWTELARHRYIVTTSNPEQSRRLRVEHDRFVASENDSLNKLRSFIELGHRGEDVGSAVTSLIASETFPAMEQHAGWTLSEAFQVFPAQVKEALIARLLSGQAIPTQASDLLRAENIEIDEGPLTSFVEGDAAETPVIPGALSVIGPLTVRKLIVQHMALQLVGHRLSEEDRKKVQEIGHRITATSLGSFARAILSLAANAKPNEIECLSDLIARHGKQLEGESLSIPGDLRSAWMAMLKGWGEVLMADASPNRRHLSALAGAISRESDVGLSPLLGRMLEADVRLWREARAKFTAALANRETLDDETRSAAQIGYSQIYRKAFINTGGNAVVSLMGTYLPDLGLEGFGIEAANVLRELWERENAPPEPGRIILGTDYSRANASRRRRSIPDAINVSAEYADAIFSVVDTITGPETNDEQHRHAVKLAAVGARLPHGNRDNTFERLLAFELSRRERHTLLHAMVLGGEVVNAELVLDAVRDLVAEWKAKRWFNLDQDLWELHGWVELLAFSNRPMAILDGLDMFDDAWKQPWRLSGVLSALGFARSPEAEQALKELPRKDPRYLNDHNWLVALERHSPITAARTLLGFICDGSLPVAEIRDKWWMARKLGGAINESGEFRSTIYRAYASANDKEIADLLAFAISEGSDQDGVLLLVRNHSRWSDDHSGYIESAVKHATVGQRPSGDWNGTHELFGIPAVGLRRDLFALIQTDGAEAKLAERCLAYIDELRDEYGSIESEPRHPDIVLGLPWPSVSG